MKLIKKQDRLEVAELDIEFNVINTQVRHNLSLDELLHILSIITNKAIIAKAKYEELLGEDNE